jgi:tripartite-type tricarboxylate transporter receptor subunit TctC
MKWNLSASLGAVVLAALLFPAAASAQGYPTRPITIVAPYPPGASTDFMARLLRDPMSEALGQPIVVDNRPGAGGTTATAGVAAAAPDGYTLLFTVNAPVTMNKFLQKSYPIDPKTAFAPVVSAAEVLLALVVHSSLPVKTVPELIAYAKQHPGKLSYGTAGIGSAHHIAGELLKQKTGIDMQHVPYRGGGPAIQDLVAGHIAVAFGTTPAVIPHVQSGAIRMLALAEAKRDPDMPDVPTVDETVPGVITGTWVGLLAPAGTPQPIIDKLNKAAVDALKRPDVIAKMKLQGAKPVGSTPGELARLINTELDHWGKVIPSIGIQPE